MGKTQRSLCLDDGIESFFIDSFPAEAILNGKMELKEVSAL